LCRQGHNGILGNFCRQGLKLSIDILKILIQYYFQEIFPKKAPPPQSPMEITRAAAIGFESGFSGFIGLIVMSPV
jgi:hypothetical protein